VLGQISEIRELQAADRRRQTVISELQRVISEFLRLLRLEPTGSWESRESRTGLHAALTALQAEVTALEAQVAGLQGLARDSTHPEPPEEAGGSA
nr:hypothetical protein [Tanacetum cinerariifolium]